LLARKGQLPPIESQTGEDHRPGLKKDVDPARVRLGTLWDIEDKLIACMDALEQEDIDSLTPGGLLDFFGAHDCPDLLVRWTREQAQKSASEGKIPQLGNWRDLLQEGKAGLDSLMNLAGLNSFTADQKEMDNHICQIWKSVKA